MTVPSGLHLAGSLLVPAVRLPRDYGRLDELSRLLVEGNVAGFIVFGGDRELTPPFLRRLREVAGRPIFLMADYERGAGQMVEGMPDLPPAMALGASGSAEDAWMAGKITALSARRLSVSVVMAPVLDVASLPENPIVGTRAFSDDPDLVAKLGLAFVEGLAEEGVIACAKHFPGHGHTALDSHSNLPRVGASREELEARELPPFRAAVRAGVPMVMTAHVVYDGLDPEVPAGFSRRVVTEMLREEWGFSGLVVTDALSMEGAKRSGEDPAILSLRAGADLLLCPEDPFATMAAIDEALRDGRLSEESLLLSHGRAGLSAADQLFEAPARKDLSAEYGYAVQSMARRTLTAVDPGGLLPRVPRAREVLGLVVDDDARPERARVLEPWAERFSGGVVHVTPEGTGVAGGLAAALRGADLVLMAVLSDVRAGKDRAGLSPSLLGFVIEVLREHGGKTVTILFGGPWLARELPAGATVFAYGSGAVMRRAALDAVLAGAELPGRLPVAVGEALPRGSGGR